MDKVLRGVNLGGWLVLEQWMTPDLFAGSQAKDEFSLCKELGQRKSEVLKLHRDNFINREDFKWLSDKVDAVRLPIGYWALDDIEPFISCAEYIDKAFDWAQEFGIKIILDFHAAPGSQNGHDHSGKVGKIEWVKPKNIDQTLTYLERLAERYAKHSQLLGIELINEPGWDIPMALLKDFYIAGYKKVREYCDNSKSVIISDAFRPDKWNGFMNGPEYSKVVLDMHLYQCFSRHDKKLNLAQHLKKARDDWNKLISNSDKPVIVGEWSLGLDNRTFKGRDESERKSFKAEYAKAQLDGFGEALGWFFWNYKTQEDMDDWNFIKSFEQGYFNE